MIILTRDNIGKRHVSMKFLFNHYNFDNYLHTIQKVFLDDESYSHEIWIEYNSPIMHSMIKYLYYV